MSGSNGRSRVNLVAVLVWGAALAASTSQAAFTIPKSGWATLTHYDLPVDYVASCGCVGASTRWPTAALNTLAYGSISSFGPACGRCARLTLLSTPLAALPPVGEGLFLDQTGKGNPSVVVKITDRCPGSEWCGATETEPNRLGAFLHWDLAWPSRGIAKDFFPGPSPDYGVWNASYEMVSCKQWAGYSDAAAQGSDWLQESSACCPSNPNADSEDDESPAPAPVPAPAPTTASTELNVTSSTSISTSNATSTALSNSTTATRPANSTRTATTTRSIDLSTGTRQLFTTLGVATGLAAREATLHRRQSHRHALHKRASDPTLASDRELVCPSYTQLIEQGLGLLSVPNTSNPLSKRDPSAATSGAASLSPAWWWSLAAQPLAAVLWNAQPAVAGRELQFEAEPPLLRA